jgi:hypothetical protein
MGKEADFGESGECAIERKLRHMGLVSAPRTPLRALIARESGAIWAAELKARVESPSPPKAGASSPGARVGQASHGIGVFKRDSVVRAVSLHSAERPVQLGALFAQEREETRRVAVEVPHVQPLRDFIACGAQRVGTPKGLRSDVGAAKPVLAPDESQELRYLFAKDWALQTSDEEDEFWDSGSLCGAPIGSCHENLRRRSRFYKTLSRVSHPTSEPEIEIVEAHSPDRCTFSDETVTSLGTLLGEETATSSRLSVPAAESSRRVKIASLDDISAPVRPESQSQLDSLIAKILTLRANSVTGNAEPTVPRLPAGEEESSENLSSGVTVPATDVNPPSDDDIREVPTSPPTVVEAPITVSAEGEEAASNAPDSEDVGATPRVQLGTLLERTWGEHGWLPLGRSQMSSPLVPSSSTNCESPVPSEREAVLLPPPEGEPVEVVSEGEGDGGAMAVGEGDGGAMAVRERAPTRVSLLSLLSQDMEADEDGVLADVLCGCRDEEEDEGATEELDPMCCVCMVGHKGAAFIPCGHTFCRKCCREVRRSIGSCPLCNQAIVDVLKLY